MDAVLYRLQHPMGKPSPHGILDLWRAGHNTYEIAKILSVGTTEVSEAYVSRRLSRLREEARNGR